MKNIIIAWLIITLTTINISVYSQDTQSDKSLIHADLLFENGQYKAAIKEYQRYLFMSENEDIEILLKVAHGLFEMNNHELSLQYYEKIYYLTDNPEIKFECRLKEVIYRIDRKEYNKALVLLYSVNSGYYGLHPQIIDLLFAISYYGLEDFKTSEKYFLKIVASDQASENKIKEIFADNKKFHKPNPNTISLLSMIIPGLGQILSAEYKEGINSFILVESIGVAAVIVGIRYSVWDAVFSIVPWYQRYLLGGSDKAEKLAIKRRAHNRNEIYLEILEILKPYHKEFEFQYF